MKNIDKIGKRVEFVLSGFGTVYGIVKTVEKTNGHNMSIVTLEMNEKDAWLETSCLKVVK
jgi:hypothetical protein